VQNKCFLGKWQKSFGEGGDALYKCLGKLELELQVLVRRRKAHPFLRVLSTHSTWTQVEISKNALRGNLLCDFHALQG
jgi:hypothetical protein